MSVVDAWIAACLLPLAVWLLISGIDDLLLDVACLSGWIRRRLFGARAIDYPTEDEFRQIPEKRTAVFVPLWREHRVIRKMLEHNLAANKYENYEFFVGCYPNDELTIAVVREIEGRSGKVHLALCPHPGPTSKADCLNWIYQRMLVYEEERGVRFELVVIHDAEDLMHREALRWINFYAERYDMVQIPVLPLPTPFRNFTHGVYCDEFAEFQTKDVPTRRLVGGFLPSNGVGTGYSRRALEKLAASSANRIFDPTFLTEDYVNGLRLYRLNCTQLFVPIRFLEGTPVATREYFPQSFRAAVRQRTRWVIGIALQTWERYGWSGGPAQIYWFWRDRKGLIGNPITFLANFVFLYGLATWLWSWYSGTPWGLAQAGCDGRLLLGTLGMQFVRTGVRTGCAARIYGWEFALGTPVRIFWGNWINFCATAAALEQYLAARLRPRPLAWLKTDHIYPSQAALASNRRQLGQVLVAAGYLTAAELEAALERKPAGMRLGEYLIAAGKLTEDAVYQALSLQQNVPFERLFPADIRRPVARALPAAVVHKRKVLPYKVASGSLFLAGPEIPTEAFQEELRTFTRLEIRFHFITPSNFEQLEREFIEARRPAEASGAQTG